MKSLYLECGQILKPHGVHGGMIISHLCDSPDIFCSLKYVYFKENGTYRKVKVKSCVPYKSAVLANLEGIETPEDVIKIRLSYIYASRDDIEKGENDFFIADLIGLDVIDINSGRKYGKLKNIINQGAQDLYVVSQDKKPDVYIPAVAEFIKEISIEKGIFISPISGMFD